MIPEIPGAAPAYLFIAVVVIPEFIIREDIPISLKYTITLLEESVAEPANVRSRFDPAPTQNGRPLQGLTKPTL